MSSEILLRSAALNDHDEEELGSNDSLDLIDMGSLQPRTTYVPITLEGARSDASEALGPKGTAAEGESKETRMMQVKLESLAWDQDYQLTPKGEIAVGELLQVIFLFLVANQSTLLSVSSVSRAWRERATYLPQWSYLRLRFPKHAPPPSIRNGPKQQLLLPQHSNNNLDSVSPTITSEVTISREMFFSYLWRNYEHAQQVEWDSMVKTIVRVKDNGFALFVCVVGFGLLLSLGFLAAWAVGSSESPKDDGWIGFQSFFFAAAIGAGGLALLVFFGTCGGKKYPTGASYRLVLHTSARTLILAYILLLIPTTVFGLLTARYRVMKEIAATPMYNASCAAVNASVDYIGQPIPYFVVFPPQSASNWVLGSASYSGLETGQRYSLLTSKPPCSLGLEIAVVNGPGFNASTWWAQFVERNTAAQGPPNSTAIVEGETLIFRTTLVNQYYPLPWYLNPDAPWKTPTPTLFGGSRPIPVIGTYAMTFPEEAPMTQASKFLEVMYITIYVACGIFVLAAMTFVCPAKGVQYCTGFWGALVILNLSPIAIIGWGAVCRWADRDFCLISKRDATTMFWVGWGLLGGFIVVALHHRFCRCRGCQRG